MASHVSKIFSNDPTTPRKRSHPTTPAPAPAPARPIGAPASPVVRSVRARSPHSAPLQQRPVALLARLCHRALWRLVSPLGNGVLLRLVPYCARCAAAPIGPYRASLRPHYAGRAAARHTTTLFWMSARVCAMGVLETRNSSSRRDAVETPRRNARTTICS